MRAVKQTLFALSIALISFTSCENKKSENVEGNTSSRDSVSSDVEKIGAVYMASNKTEKNSLVGFAQMSDGSLEKIGEFESGGTGTGNIEIFDWGYDETHPLKDGVDPLISAYGVFKTQDGKFVLTVNSGDGSISSFSVKDDYSLELASTVKAGDIHPISIASHGNMVYVANSAAASSPPFAGNINGYTISETGELTEIAGSKRNLGARPSCISFTPDGKFLVVNELATGMVKVFSVGEDGLVSTEPVSQIGSPHDADNGRWLPIPVGFDVVSKGDKYVVLMSEARFLNNKGALREEAGKVAQSPKYSWQTGSTSSYSIDSSGVITLVSGDVMTGAEMENGQIANCWVEASKDGNTLWAANALSSSLSQYSINEDGSIKLKEEKLFKVEDESLFFSDLYLSNNGKFLNQLIGNKGEIMVFQVGEDGSLSKVGSYPGAPAVGSYGVITL